MEVIEKSGFVAIAARANNKNARANNKISLNLLLLFKEYSNLGINIVTSYNLFWLASTVVLVLLLHDVVCAMPS
jgi:hypothetical protein